MQSGPDETLWTNLPPDEHLANPQMNAGPTQESSQGPKAKCPVRSRSVRLPQTREHPASELLRRGHCLSERPLDLLQTQVTKGDFLI